MDMRIFVSIYCTIISYITLNHLFTCIYLSYLATWIWDERVEACKFRLNNLIESDKIPYVCDKIYKGEKPVLKAHI